MNQRQSSSALYKIFSGLLFVVFAAGVIFIWYYIFNSNSNTQDTNSSSSGQQTNSSEQEIITISPERLSSFIPNPGIGLQYDPTVRNPSIPETVVYAPRQDVSWDILNPQENVYQWDVLDSYLNEAVSQGKMFSFRVYTMRGEEYGGNRVPQWVLNKGVEILPSGDPNYQSCIYQEEWAKFVDALRIRYDGNPNIAFIDISGYSAFNEWSWNDDFTEWDFQWEEAYANGTASPSDFTTLDGQARRRLVDMFVGGSFFGHQCTQPDGTISQIDYSYPGFQQTQLVMPYAGIRQSSQYAVYKNAEVGFRYDCLGENIDSVEKFSEKLGNEISQTWPVAPVVFEFCGRLDDDYPEAATALLQLTHGSLVHANDYVWDDQENLLPIITSIGYRYELMFASYATNIKPGSSWEITTAWKNVGYAPSYPKMGQTFSLHYLLANDQGQIVADFIAPTDISSWMPADPLQAEPPENEVTTLFSLPESLQSGTYEFLVAIMDERTGQPINLPIEGKLENGFYSIGNLTIISD